MMKWILLFALLAACEGYKILVVFPMPSKSHSILGEGVVRLLINAGHEVTYITPFPIKNPKGNLHQVEVSSIFDFGNEINLKAIMDKTTTVGDPRNFFNKTQTMNKETILNENVQKLMLDPKQTFDLVIVEWMFSELYCGFAAVFNCPYIWLSSTEPISIVLSLIDEKLNPSYNSDFLSAHAPPFSFLQRAKELAIYILASLFKDVYVERIESKNFEELFGPVLKKKGRPVPTFAEVKYNASLMLGNSHVSIGHPVRLPQNYKAVRGYHVDPDVKPLPADLKKILDNAKNGLIYFSMGSNLNSKHMADELKKGLLKTFSELKQTVLWKFEENMENLPKNVHIVQWAPQTSILAHPNCILFISHGGGLSTTETIYFGKPTIGIPVFGDQFTNVDMAAQKGFSIRVNLDYDLPQNLKVALDEILNNPSYAAKAKELSFVYHHRPVAPGVELVHWVEHVIKTRGAPHLRSFALFVPFYQKYFLDVMAVLVAIIYVVYRVFKSLCKRVCKRSNSNIKKKKN